MTRYAQFLGFLVAIILLAVVAVEAATGGYTTPFSELLRDGWGRTITLDLYLGLVIAVAWVIHREGSMKRRIPWILALLIFGNIATGVYVAWVARGSADAAEFFNGSSSS